MRNFERLAGNKLAVMSTVVALGLGVSACGEASDTKSTTTTEHDQKPQSKESMDPVLRDVTEHPNGSLTYKTASMHPRDNRGILYCQSSDLIDQLEEPYAYTVAITRSPNHHFCADGRVTKAEVVPYNPN